MNKSIALKQFNEKKINPNEKQSTFNYVNVLIWMWDHIADYCKDEYNAYVEECYQAGVFEGYPSLYKSLKK